MTVAPSTTCGTWRSSRRGSTLPRWTPGTITTTRTLSRSIRGHDQRTAMRRLTRDEMIHLVERLQRGEGNGTQLSEWLDALKRSIPNPNVSELIFSDEDLTAEQIIDRASTYRPIE